MNNPFFDLLAIDGSLAVKRAETYTAANGVTDTLVTIEPGDATRYTVHMDPGARHVMAWVGDKSDFVDRRDRGQVVMCSGGKWLGTLGRSFTGGDYNWDILSYFVRLAAGHDVQEPEGLALRRRLWAERRAQEATDE